MHSKNKLLFLSDKSAETTTQITDDSDDDFEYIKDNLGEEVLKSDLPDEFISERSFDIAMNSIGLLNLRTGEISVESLNIDEEDNQFDTLFARHFDSICTQGVSACHSLLAFSNQNENNNFLCLSHSVNFPEYTKERMLELMRKNGIKEEQVNFLFVGGTEFSWKNELEKFILTNSKIKVITKNEYIETTGIDAKDEEDWDSEICDIYMGLNKIVVLKTDGNNLICRYDIQIKDNKVDIEKSSDHNKLLTRF